MQFVLITTMCEQESQPLNQNENRRTQTFKCETTALHFNSKTKVITKLGRES